MTIQLHRRLSTKSPLKDLLSGLTTAIVSLPLAIAFGIASGAGAQAGLYGAVAIGLIAALFGGTSTLISEPTGPMTVLMAAILVRMASLSPEYGLVLAFTTVMVAGLVQIAFGVFRLGRYFTMMPYSVISGFMSGIGLLLIITQLPSLLGSIRPAAGIFQSLEMIRELLVTPDLPEIFIGLGALLILFLTPGKITRFIPGQLLALGLGSIGAFVFLEPGSYRTIGELGLGMPRFILPRVNPEFLPMILVDGVILGILGSIDTLLTAMISDSLTREQHNSNRELIGQGLGNLVSGLIGGLPGAGATMGTVVNIQTGSRSPLAGVFRAGFLLLIVTLFSPLLSLVPLGVLAAIAIKVGLNILDWSFLGRAHKISLTASFLMYSVMVLTVFVDLLVAVGAGIFIANIITIERLSALHSTNIRTVDPSGDPVVLSPVERKLLEAAEKKVVLFHLSGPMIFGVAQAIAKEASLMNSEVRALILDLTEVSFLGTTVMLALENLILDALQGNTSVWISGSSVEQKLSSLNLPQGRLFFCETRLQALEQAVLGLQDATRV